MHRVHHDGGCTCLLSQVSRLRPLALLYRPALPEQTRASACHHLSATTVYAMTLREIERSALLVCLFLFRRCGLLCFGSRSIQIFRPPRPVPMYVSSFAVVCPREAGGRAGGCLRSICLLWFCPELPLQFPCSQKPSPEGIGLRRLPRSLCTRIYNIYIQELLHRDSSILYRAQLQSEIEGPGGGKPVLLM